MRTLTRDWTSLLPISRVTHRLPILSPLGGFSLRDQKQLFVGTALVLWRSQANLSHRKPCPYCPLSSFASVI